MSLVATAGIQRMTLINGLVSLTLVLGVCRELACLREWLHQENEAQAIKLSSDRCPSCALIP